MDRVLLRCALLLLCAPAGEESGLGRAWSLGWGVASPLQPGAAGSASNFCSPLDCVLPGPTLVDRPQVHTCAQETSNGTWYETDSDWGFYVLVIFVVAASLGFLCFRPPVRKWLVSIYNRFKGRNRSHLRNSGCSRTHPRNYGTLTDVAFRSAAPEDAQGRAEGKDSQGESGGASKMEADGCGDGTDHGAALEVTVEVEDVA